ncbi:MAG: hypothetical protein JXQ83_07575 [Candidatus Glassbacteria bacterium]|nr:hypothetical protein [Candidatus Glassbacteria bacterium]
MAMFAATVGGAYENVGQAQEAMGGGFEKEYVPDHSRGARYDALYGRYCRLGEFIGAETTGSKRD